MTAKNVLGGPLLPCSLEPLTGWYRDGCCNTDAADAGLHTVCAVMTEEFLSFSQSAGNDLSTPRPEYGFPGLNPGDRWCLCAGRWEEARVAGFAPEGCWKQPTQRHWRSPCWVTSRPTLCDHPVGRAGFRRCQAGGAG